MKWAYQIFLGQSTLALSDVRDVLSVFPSIFSLEEEISETRRNIRAYVEIAERAQMTEQQHAALRTLGVAMHAYLLSPRWEPGELEAQQERERSEEKLRRSAFLEEHFPQRRYYLCYFRQQQHALDPYGPIIVSFVHSISYPPDDYSGAQKRAKELEAVQYARKDFNIQIEARLAESEEKARQGIFLDE